MAALAAAVPYITAATAVVSAGSQIGQARAQKQAADIEAKQLRAQSISDTATAARQAKIERRKAQLLSSRVKALVATGGGDINSPDIQNMISDIDERGEYNALSALYSGKTSAKSKGYAAQAARSRGRQSAQSGYATGIGTVAGGFANAYNQYGG